MLKIWKKNLARNLERDISRKNAKKNLEKLGENLAKSCKKNGPQLLLSTRFPHGSCTPGHHPKYLCSIN